jgi:hypothetical protein
MNTTSVDYSAIRAAIAGFELSSRVEPNEAIASDRAFLPIGHRGVLDLRRQLVVGNRGMGKSFWTHALLNEDLREKLADFYGHKQLKRAQVLVGFNGSIKIGAIAPTTDEIAALSTKGVSPDLIWRAVFLRAATKILGDAPEIGLADHLSNLSQDSSIYSQRLTQLDEYLSQDQRVLVVVFDALDRLGMNWGNIRELTRALLALAVGLQSFSSIRAKIFMRIDQFSDDELFRFPDSSKIRNDHVNLVWRPTELYGLLLYEIMRDEGGREALQELATTSGTTLALPTGGEDKSGHIKFQQPLIELVAGEFMGSDKKRGRVYTWVPLHLSDALDTCSPRTFLTAWKKAAEHEPAPVERALDHLGLQDGVRSASTARLRELYEEYPWIEPALEALRRQFVPISREQLFEIWSSKKVVSTIASDLVGSSSSPLGLSGGEPLEALLAAMRNVAVMEERANGKINVPDIFRVEAEILRKGGVAVPKRYQ